MIERFNFYDIYGYLIPGAVWLALLGLPFYLTVPGLQLSVAALTTIGLGGGYLAGHYLSGLARVWLPSVKVSQTMLDDTYDKLAPTLKHECIKHLRLRFGLNWSDPGVSGEVFYLFRTALLQGKAGSYVEQYQGVATMTRGLAVGALLTMVFYVAFVAGSVLPLTGLRPDWALLPLVMVAMASVLPALVVKQLVGEKPPQGESLTHPARHFFRENAEGVVFSVLLALAGVAGGSWHELTRRQAYELALVAAICSLAYWRFKLASAYFSELMAQATCRDFLVLSTSKT